MFLRFVIYAAFVTALAKAVTAVSTKAATKGAVSTGAATEGAMQISVKAPTWEFKYFLDVERSDTIEDVKYKIYDRWSSVPPNYQQLFFSGEQLELKDDRTLSSYNIEGGSALVLIHHKDYVPKDNGRLPLSQDPYASERKY